LIALVFDGELRLCEDYAEPVPAPGEVLIRVIAAGICRTDIEIARGYMDFKGVPGHEFVGEVLEAGNADLIGKRVTGEINCPCGECRICRKGLGKHCPHRTVLGILGRDGAFAEELCLPEENLHVLPAGLSDDEAVFVEPVAAAFEMLDRHEISPSDRVAVLGDGKLGLLVAQALATAGCEPLVVGRHVSKLRIAQDMGMDTAFAGTYIRGRFDYVVECTGSAAGLEAAMEIIAPRGVIVLKSTMAEARPLNLFPIVVDEVTISGSRCGPFGRAIQALEVGEVKVEHLISDRFPLARGVEAMCRAAEPGVLKVILDVARPEHRG